MNALHRFVDFFWDSPTYGRDRANLISGFSIGTAALLLNGVVLIFVLPLLYASDNQGFQRLTDNVGFGQLLALILLGGATVFATFLIPLRLVTVFFEPRVGRYFDQIVLSGISPLRFVIGKATSQNLFLGLTLFLLIPYFVLSMTLGGVNLSFCAAGLFLVWLYCMSLALVTLWVSLFMNELMAAALVIALATLLNILGCIPIRLSPIVFSPFPVLLHPVYTSIPSLDETIDRDYIPQFVACSLSLISLMGASIFAIYLGPLYGIIRENSTFGEVVRTGDSKRKRWFRFRLHIQRSSEIAFFYRNRSASYFRHEGLIRWGIGICGLTFISVVAYSLFGYSMWKNVQTFGPGAGQMQARWFADLFHRSVLLIHGFGLAIAAILFSHSKNTTYLRLPLIRGLTAEVSTLDTFCFLLFLVFSTFASISTPFQFEKLAAIPNNVTIFPQDVAGYVGASKMIDFVRVSIEGSVVISLAGLAVYAFHRVTCLGSWMKTSTSVTVGILYSILICTVPFIYSLVILETNDLRQIQWLADTAPTVTAMSPTAAMMILVAGGIGGPFGDYASTTPFYILHVALIVLTVLWFRRAGRKLRLQYLTEPAKENVGG